MQRAGLRLVMMGAAIVIAASGTPLPLWFYGIGVVLLVISLWPRPLAADSVIRRRRICTVTGFLALWCVSAGAWELTYRFPPRLDGKPQYDSLVVIGDSVSAGLLGPREQTWPKQFRERYFANVVDLSAEGATRHALRQSQALNARPGHISAVVLIEIGGNDYFESVRPSDFAADLDRLLTSLEGPNRQLLMLELPLPPFLQRLRPRAARACSQARRTAGLEAGVRGTWSSPRRRRSIRSISRKRGTRALPTWSGGTSVLCCEHREGTDPIATHAAPPMNTSG